MASSQSNDFCIFLVALDQDVEIVIKPHRNRNNAPALYVS
jgi:hypothetical protein